MHQEGFGQMNTLTIHALDPATERRIRVKARKEKKSLNQLLKELLSGSAGVSTSSRPEDHRAEFQEFSGIWSDKDVDEFNKAISDLERVDEKDWQ
jgi:plasmid stability protein